MSLQLHAQDTFDAYMKEMNKVIVGYGHIKERVFESLVTGANVLLTSVPGLSKTTLIETMAAVFTGSRKAIVQFTPDLMPKDLLGFNMFDQESRTYKTKHGKLYGANFFLADEINRAPATTQAALLRAMQERKISIEGSEFDLENPFIVLATQNPIEQEGTYNLPEAQVDRFQFNLLMGYLSKAEELRIAELVTRHGRDLIAAMDVQSVIPLSDILTLGKDIREQIDVPPTVYEYAVDLARATRRGEQEFSAYLSEHEKDVSLGGSPRAYNHLVAVGKVVAALKARTYVTHDDIKSVAHDVLRHRIGLTPQAIHHKVTTDSLIDKLLERVPVVSSPAMVAVH